MADKSKGLGIFVLVMLITGSIDSIRNLPTAALFGTSLIFFFVLATVVFLLPVSLVSAELSSTWTKHGGIYNWVKLAFGDKVGFLAIWLQWINTMVWYPSILSFVAGTAAFLVDPKLAENKLYLIGIILASFWGMTLVNLKGIKTSAWFASVCAMIGMALPMVFIVVLAVVWVVMGHPMQLHLTVGNLMPSFGHSQSWISLTAIVTAFLGMELATVHVRNVEKPQRTFPLVILVSAFIILITMLLGSLAIAIVLPADQIQLVEGVMQAMTSFLAAYHIAWMIPIVAVMLVVGSLGEMINWMISPAKGLLQAARDGYLPTFFTKENKHGVASRVLLMQAILVSLVCLAFLLMPSVNASYWLLTDLSTQLYVLMYVFMFAAALYLRYKFPGKKRPFAIPGGKVGIWVLCVLGIIGCGITLTVGFIPPAGIVTGSTLHYVSVFGGGMLLMIIPGLLAVARKAWLAKSSGPSSVASREMVENGE